MVDGDSDVANAITEAGNTGSGLYAAIDAALTSGDVDFSALTAVNYNAPDYGDVAVVGSGSFADLSDKQLYMNLGDSLNEANGSGYFFFESESGATGGELKVCLKYSDGNSNTTEFEETEGVLLSGTWLSLDDSKLILKLAGALSVSLTDKGMQNTKHRYSLSYGGEIRSWLSDDGLLGDEESQSVTEQPTNDATCETLLNADNSNQF
jgi:hypothetical protein